MHIICWCIEENLSWPLVTYMEYKIQDTFRHKIKLTIKSLDFTRARWEEQFNMNAYISFRFADSQAQAYLTIHWPQRKCKPVSHSLFIDNLNGNYLATSGIGWKGGNSSSVRSSLNMVIYFKYPSLYIYIYPSVSCVCLGNDGKLAWLTFANIKRTVYISFITHWRAHPHVYTSCSCL